MWKTLISVFLCLSALFSSSRAAFVRNGVSVIACYRSPLSVQPEAWNQHVTKRNMLADGSLADSIMASNMWISTIDSDIANIPQNEFAPVFMGGIIVMFGGVISALIVGYILESKNLYANVVADSYAQGADDEEFWKGLSDEEKKKTQALIDKLNAKKASENGVPVQIEASAKAVSTVDDSFLESVLEKNVPELDMFSDYVDAGTK
jgi:hypothetical protein